MDAHSQWTGLDAGRLERITDHIERNYIGPQKIAGAQIAVSRHGHQAYLKSFGSMDLERQKPMMDDAIFRIYSMTKPITSIALMTLYEKGYFQLNDPVSRYVPSWKTHRVWVSGEGDSMVTEAPRRAVTFKDVLSHTGGFTYGGGLPGVGDQHPVDKIYRGLKVRSAGGDDTMMEFLDKLGQVPLLYHPGERWMYSLATDICGALVEVISGKPFAQYLQEEIFGPLGMKDTSFFVTPDKIDRFCANYQRGPDKKLKVIDDPVTSAFAKEPGFKSGGGGLTGTTADYMRFCEMLRRGGELDGARVIGPRTLEMMHMNHLAGGKDLTQMAIGGFSETANEGVGFGLGFASTMSQTQTASLGTGDYYWGGAASTIFWVDPKEDLSVVFMTQLMPSGTFNFRGQLKSLIYSAIID
ncbi:MAG: beta-lactamase family protein [Phenylobacterium sp.]|uniref:serine hydrolase domain-containing protein n=1 Tax=Phenylobacterium sp. TaxID=1871053 RepID=UPI001B761E22|nr:serine hydrolase domain-containing protein [Phenylobacterium sp.]MBP7815707.1 beta-lactamase family protein [Phenylobacterium sp.]MBP9230371.1 beta-lactamase family protein [Phenylobacterium sp.]MBP9754469.1 beta-lactamase family protein [Phenylobacterium sp.]